jgi:LAO/AO transport system kinase
MKVAVLAVDPSSSISGGALLGDRIRMRAHTEDRGVFIRSMATRGYPGGLSRTAWETVLVFDAMGFGIIVIETVGVGQDEVEIAQLAHTSAVVSLPGTGDDIQAMKAGLLEIGDVFIVNKADVPGADEVVFQLENMLEITGRSESSWRPPILKTVAIKGEGLTGLADALWNHRRYLIESGKFSEYNREREFRVFRRLVMEMAADRLFERIQDRPAYLDLLDNLGNRNIDPFSAAERVVGEIS